MKKKINETNVEMDIDTYNKVRTKLKPTDNVVLLDKKPKTPSMAISTATNQSSVSEDDSVIKPTDVNTIKYLSDVKDSKTGEISKPFTIGDKKYQMVRGTTPKKEVVMGVYCYDDLNENGENIIHPVDHFEKTIAKPFHEQQSKLQEEKPQETNNEEIIDHLNLKNLDGYKHFFIDKKTGEIKAKFKTTKEMVKSGVKLGDDDDYVNINQLKKIRFSKYLSNDISEDVPSNEVNNTNIPKLQADVKKLVDLIKNKFANFLAKLDKPIEQAQFLTTMATEIGVPINKLSSIISTYKDIAQTNQTTVNNSTVTNESKIFTKNQLLNNKK